MNDQAKTNHELIEEISVLKQKIQELEESEAERKQVEKALRESEKKYRSIFNNAVEGFFQSTPEGQFLNVNPAFARIFGYASPDELIRTISNISQQYYVNYEDRLRYMEILQEKGTVENFEFKARCKDGAAIWVSNSTRAIVDEDGKIIYYEGIVEDITDRKQAEETLRESEAKFRALAESSSSAIFLIQGTKYIYINPAFESIIGYTMEDLADMNFWDFVHPDMRELIRNRGLNRLKMQNPPSRYEIKFIAKNGQEKWVDYSATVIELDNKPTIVGSTFDISERKQTEEALRESEERYRNVFENHTAVKLLINPDTGSIIEANKAAVNYYGWSHDRLKQMNIQEINTLSPEDVKKEMEKAIKQKQIHFEFRHRRADGSIRDVEVFSSKIKLKGKDILHSIIHDITDRKRAEEALRDSEIRYQSIFENTGTVMLIIEKDMTISFANAEFEKLTGYRRKEIEGKKKWTEFVEKSDLERMIQQHQLRRTDKDLAKRSYEFRLIHRDGHIKDIYLLVDIIPGTKKSVASLIDITERKRAERMLQRQNVYLESLNETALGLMSRMDLADLLRAIIVRGTRFVGAEEGWICIYESQDGGFEYKAAIGKGEYRIGKRFESGRGIAGEVWRTGQTVLVDDYLVWPQRVNEEGYALRRATVAVPLRYDGRLTGTLGLAHYDAAKRFEDDDLAMLERLAELASIALNNARLYDQVKQELAERTRLEAERDLMQAKLLQIQKMEAVGTLAGGIAHDFNNLLMGIQGYASLTLLDLDPSHPHYERLKRIEEQVQSGADLTKQLLGFASGGRYEVKPADMNDILKKSSSMFGRTKKEITIHRKYGKDLSAVEVDRGQMEQVFMNLFVNAWQAMPGGGEIYLETEDVLLNDEQAISYAIKPGRYVKITVTDTGTGMDDKTRERIFDPFFTTKEMGRGTGLGLATVYGIIKGHGGMIHVDSEPGHGTTFNIYLPASEREVIGKKTETGDIARGAETILLVDDEKMVLEVSREMLESLGYRVYAAGSGQEALAVYMEKRKE
ncbi:MAG: PAS domain S-box protein, partial [Deltaproteobacteria bacterium]|nr:PAS domain S-box protein [Deltaproteobacteria bacterium]